jgi:hypothetical protein
MIDARKGVIDEEFVKDLSADKYRAYYLGLQSSMKGIKETPPRAMLSKIPRAMADLFGLRKLYYGTIASPDVAFGEEKTKPIIDAIERWQKAVYEAKSEVKINEQKKLYQKLVVPTVERFLETNEFVISQMTPRQRAFQAYLKDMKEGVDVFGKQGNWFTETMDRYTGLQMANNIDIMLLNFFEAPRLIAERPLQAVPAFLKMVAKGGLLKEIPELKLKGVFGSPMKAERHGITGGIVNWSSNALRAWSYYAGELKGGVAEGKKALQSGSFEFIPGNSPGYTRGPSRTVFTLMRYAIETAKWQTGHAVNVFDGLAKRDFKRASASLSTLIIWGVLQDVLLGKKAVLPFYLMAGWQKMDKESYEENMGENESLLMSMLTGTSTKSFAQATLGSRFAAKGAPGGIALSVVTDMFQKDFERIAKKISKAQEEGNFEASTYEIIDGLMLLGGLSSLKEFKNIPSIGKQAYEKVVAFWGDKNIRALAQAAHEVAFGEVSEGEYPSRVAEKISSVRLGDEPATTDKGQEEDEQYMSKYAR